ncbi:MAG: type II toxin-antitoxin system RelE/ParE family toxin [Minwuia sp.]|uniref:type II toxin-antitoxin system RelE/ParE family toxin n=1 Tax=Minwuia sp. TaxID=2493630 RepID=UPI003A8A450F
MKFVFLPEAVEDIDRLYDFLIEKDAIAAQKAMLAIDEGISLLLDNPYIGVKMGGQPERQLFVPFGKSAYVLRYRVDEPSDTLAVIRVWHGREARL